MYMIYKKTFKIHIINSVKLRKYQHFDLGPNSLNLRSTKSTINLLPNM